MTEKHGDQQPVALRNALEEGDTAKKIEGDVLYENWAEYLRLQDQVSKDGLPITSRQFVNDR